MLQGRMFMVTPETYDAVTINSGTQGENRIDLIVARYTASGETNTQSMEWVVIQGTPTTGQPVAPSPLTGDIDSGDTPVDMPMFQVLIEGITITSVTPVFESYAAYELDPNRTIPSNADLNDYTDFGCYVCMSGTVAQTLSNCPYTAGGFTLRVLRGTGASAYRVQEIITATGDRVYRRCSTTGIFDEWKYNLYGTDQENLQGITIKKVWENAAIESTFAAQTINIGVTRQQCDALLIPMWNSSRSLVGLYWITKDEFQLVLYGIQAYPCQRSVEWVNDTLVFSISEILTSEWQTNNDNMKPRAVYAIKGVS